MVESRGAGGTGPAAAHEPVLLEETMKILDPRPGGVYVDCTVGYAGHAFEILARSEPDGVLIGIDRDPEAIEAARRRLSGFGDRFRLVNSNYERLPEIVLESGVRVVDGVLFDLGVSSAQLDRPERGFSYNVEAPLDMRMDPRQATTAAELVNELDERELERIIREYGEERWASRIARFIAERRRRMPIRTTTDLVEIVKAAVPAAARRKGGHPARRTFQALRIATNSEIEPIEGALRNAVRLTKRGGRVCAVSFHSLEDRIVKRTFASLAPGEVVLLTRKPVVPAAAEMARNPRSRSAKLRAVEVRVVLGLREE